MADNQNAPDFAAAERTDNGSVLLTKAAFDSLTDEVVALRAEVERLTRERDDYRQAAVHANDWAAQAEAEMKQAKAEVERLQVDKARLDWWDRIWADDDIAALDRAWQSCTPGPAGSGRAAIDAARARPDGDVTG